MEEEIIKNLIEKNLELSKRIRDVNLGSKNEAYSFIISCVKDILFCDSPFNEEKLKKIITDGGEDGGMDLFYDDGNIIHIMDLKNTNTLETKSFKDFNDNLIKYIFNEADSEEIEKLNPRIKSQLKSFYSDQSSKKIKVYIIRNSVNNFTKKDKKMLEDVEKYSDVEILFFNRNDLIDFLLLSENFLHEWIFRVDKKDMTYKKDKSEYVLKISLSELFNLVKQAKDKNNDLFAKNVRSFINNKSLSTSIINTILNKPEVFHLYHNGITFSVLDVKEEAKNSFRLINPQIINGCQTVNTIYEYFHNKANDANLKKTKVFCKIYKLKKEEIEKVCEASNTQVKITHLDLRSNDDVQIKLEKYINSIPHSDYLYERKKGVKKKNKTAITMSDLGQWIYSCKFEEPADSKNKKSELFEIVSKQPLYRKIFADHFDAKEIKFFCDCGIFVKKEIKKKLKKDRKLLKYADLHIMAGMFLLKKISTRSFNKIFSSIKKVIKKPIISKYGDDYNKIFTKEKNTWMLIKKELLK